MHRAVVALAAILVLTLGVALAAGQGDSSRHAPRAASHRVEGPQVLIPDLGGAIDAHARLVAIIGWADAVQANETIVAVLVAQSPPVVERAPTPNGLQATGGRRSSAWWEAIAMCESGNTNAWRTGYYGLEADRPVGGMSKDAQLAWAQSIYAQYGDSAWGCSPVAWSNVPGG